MTINKYIKPFVITLSLVLLSMSNAFALVITHGPYLIDQTETAVTVVWFTDVDCIAAVEYGTGGNYTRKVEVVTSGIMDIGRRHEVRLSGLTAGQIYNYRVTATEVTSYVAYYSELGSTIKSSNLQFTTFDKNKSEFTFYFASDIMNDANRIKTLLQLAEWEKADFMVFGGNGLYNLENESTLFTTLIDPSSDAFADTKPMVFLRGNLEMNGSIAPSIFSYVPNSSERFYYTFSHGQALFLVFDSGQDSADASPKYGGLMRSEPYLQDELAWFKKYIQDNNSVIAGTPFKIALAHQPDWGYGDQSEWDDVANSADVSLLLAGHDLVYSHTEPGSGKNFHTVVVGQDQLCKITVSATELTVQVVNSAGTEVDAFTIN